MTNRQTVEAQRYTFSVDGLTISNFISVDTAEHNRRTGRITPSGSNGDVVTVSNAVEGGQHTLTKQYDSSEYDALKRVRNPEATLVGRVVDSNGRKVGDGDRYTGVFVGVTKAGLDTESAEALTMTIRFDADGEIG